MDPISNKFDDTTQYYHARGCAPVATIGHSYSHACMLTRHGKSEDSGERDPIGGWITSHLLLKPILTIKCQGVGGVDPF